MTFPLIKSSIAIDTEQPTAYMVVCRSPDFDNPIAPAAKIKPRDRIKTTAGHTSSHLE